MIDFDHDLVPDFEEIAIRELMVKSFVTRSIMDIGQKHINFGNVDKTERRTKRIVIRNKAEVPLLYSIRKSGSIASGDIIFQEYRAGVIRGYGTREVEFVFDPSLPGVFQEKLTIENVQNPENDQALIVKANIKQLATFFIESPILSFGPCRLNSTVMQTIQISNTSTKQIRIFEVGVDVSELKFLNCQGEVTFSVEMDEDENMMIDKESEEKIEQLEQKLKIAIRKGRPEKALKINEELVLLKSGKKIQHLRSESIVDDEKKEHKIKQTAHSIQFSIYPRCIKLVKVFFKPFLKTPEIFTKDLCFEICPIHVSIHEKKNTDILKTVLMNATVCYDESSYQKMKKEFKWEQPLDIWVEKTLPQTPTITPNTIQVELQVVDLGKVELNEVKDCYFTLQNTTDKKLDYIISCKPIFRQSIKKIRNRGYLDAGENRQINLAIQPSGIGPKSIQLVVRSSVNFEQHVLVTFNYYVVYSQYLEITNSKGDYLLQGDEKGYDLDLGFCYVDVVKKFAKIISVMVKNVTDQKIFVGAQSNLAQQCFLFIDLKLEVPLNSNSQMVLEPGERKEVFIALQPGLLSNKKPRDDYRSLVGGIRFFVSVENSDLVLSKKIQVNTLGHLMIFTHSLKFVACIGQSILDIPNQMINLDNLKKDEVVKGVINIRNVTFKMPLEYSLKTESTALKLSRKVGKIEPEEEFQDIGFDFVGSRYGYYNEVVTCVNLNNSAQEIQISIRGFIDPLMLEVKNLDQEGYDLEWEGVYATYDQKLSIHNTSTELVQELELKNVSDNILVIQMISTIPIPVYLKTSQKQVNHDTDGFYECGPEISLKRGEKTIVMVSPPDPSPQTTDLQKVLSGKKFKQQGTLLFINKATKLALKSINFQTSFAMSIASIEPNSIDFGKVGHVTFWKDAKESFVVFNKSELDLHYDLEHPNYYSLEIPSHQKIIPVGKSHTITLVLNPRMLPSGIEGFQTDLFRFTNLRNENSIDLKSSYFVTQLELRFERLQNSELVLPPLQHPQLSTLPCDNWFTVTNASDHELKFGIGCQVAPELRDFVSLEVLSRSSNAILDGLTTLAAKATLELKIRANTIEKVRINDLSLIDPNGLIFGTFSVTSNPNNQEDVKGVTEIFAIRGVLVQGNTFSVSETRLTYSSANFSDSDDEEKIATPIGQKHSLIVTNLSSVFFLDLKIFLDYPIEFSSGVENLFDISPLDEYGEIHLQPKGTIQIFLTLRQSSIYGASEDVKLNFTDINTITKQSLIVPVIFEDVKVLDFQPPDVNNLFEKPEIKIIEREKNCSNCFELKGFKKVFNTSNGSQFNGMYILDLGQLETSSSPLVKKISMEIENTSTLKYKIFNSNVDDYSWLNFSKSEGVLDYLSGLSHSILLNVSLGTPGSYLSYVVFENLDNPSDIKYAKIMVKVVSRNNSRRTQDGQGLEINPGNLIFGIVNSLNVMNVGTVAYGKVYTGRCIIVQNWEPVPLDFEIKCLIPEGDSSEVRFTRTNGDVFETFRVKAKSTKKIYLDFILFPFQSNSKSFEIVLSCTSVTENDKKIVFEADCFQNKLQVSSIELFFAEPAPQLKTEQIITLTNKTNKNVEGHIVFESPNFTFELLNKQKTKYTSITSRIRTYLDIFSDESQELNHNTQTTGMTPFLLEPLANLKLKITPNIIQNVI
jgi:hypothetical protein